MKVQEYLKQQGVAFEYHEHVPAYTAQEVAAEEHVSGNRVAKAVVVRTDEDFVLCVLPASYKLDMNKVKAACNARHVRLADEQEMARLFPDVEVGAEPPIGEPYGLPTLVDRHLAEHDRILFQAGTHREAVEMSFDDYQKLARAKVTDLAVHL